MKAKKIQFRFRRRSLYEWLKAEAKKADQPLTGFMNDILDRYYYAKQKKDE